MFDDFGDYFNDHAKSKNGPQEIWVEGIEIYSVKGKTIFINGAGQIGEFKMEYSPHTFKVGTFRSAILWPFIHIHGNTKWNDFLHLY